MLKDIEEALLEPPLTNQWATTLAMWDEASEDERAKALAWVSTLRDRFVEAARDINDDFELPVIAAIQYIEYKAHWMRLNTQMNYQMFNKGESDIHLMYRATMLSQLLGALEPLIGDDEIDTITDFLSSPLSSDPAF